METKHTTFLLHLLFFFTLLTLTPPNNASSLNATAPSPSPCTGSIAECSRDVEMLMESDISRRFLGQRRYISPGALKPDQPVCNGGAAGQPYSGGSSCIPEPSNPYHRGCSRYYRCRDDA
ncbi:protein RALF-like 32 [Salvia divinorum]|uniref:Protein RALF-like 32 n=1 Tax=Salvia divinorum TaxID=28513 RepID=A0ABD1I2P5_SALDI